MKKYGVAIGAAALFALTGCVATMPYNQVSPGGAAPGGPALGEEPCCVPAGSNEPCGGPGELPCCPGNDGPVVPPPVVAPHHPTPPPSCVPRREDPMCGTYGHPSCCPGPQHPGPHHPTNPSDCKTCDEAPQDQCPQSPQPIPQCEQNQPAPPEILPGECYARCLVDAVHITRNRAVVTRCGYDQPYVVDNGMGECREHVLIQEEAQGLKCMQGEPVRVEVHPAFDTWECTPGRWDYRDFEYSECIADQSEPTWINVPQSVTCEYDELSVIEPQFQDQQCCWNVKGSKWDKTKCSLKDLQEGIKDCDTICLDEIDREQCVNSSVLVRPGEIAVVPKTKTSQYMLRKVDRPAESPCRTKTKRIRVMVQPPDCQVTHHEAQYDSLPQCAVQSYPIPPRWDDVVIPHPEQEGKFRPVPPEIQCVPEKVQVCPPVMIWKKVLCEDDRTSQRMRDIQMNLNRAGYSVPVDGTFNPATRQAVERYQRDKGLPMAVGGDLTIETLESLGVY